jgi:hypothetical protein
MNVFRHRCTQNNRTLSVSKLHVFLNTNFKRTVAIAIVRNCDLDHSEIRLTNLVNHLG